MISLFKSGMHLILYIPSLNIIVLLILQCYFPDVCHVRPVEYSEQITKGCEKQLTLWTNQGLAEALEKALSSLQSVGVWTSTQSLYYFLLN